jgi:ribonuclease/clavin/mitogillin
VLSIRYHSTNCFFMRSSMRGQLLAVDAGWPGTLYEYARLMKTIGCNLENIAWSIVTHFHMDHAGLLSEFIDRGITCYVFENQVGAIDAMEKTIEKNNKKYKRIEKEKLQLMNIRDSRKTLESIGISGEVVVTDYHSPDSITFVSDDAEAIIGDLPPAGQMMPDDRRFLVNWEILRKMGAKKIYPSHAEIFQLEME